MTTMAASGDTSDKAWQGREHPRSTAAKLGIVPTRSRGQNFLAQETVASRIVAAARLEPGDKVVEIGPGLGILTAQILKSDIAQLHLIEVDRRLAANLTERFGTDSRVEIVNCDFLDLDFASAVGEMPVKVVGNLPFSVAAAILRMLDENQRLIVRMVLMFQREVGERIRAHPGDEAYGALTVFTQLYWRVSGHFRVEAGNFHPRPRVDAEVLTFVPSERVVDHSIEPAVLRIVRAAFGNRRKTLRNSLTTGLKCDRGAVETMLELVGIKPTDRAESLSTAEFIRIAQAFRELVEKPDA